MICITYLWLKTILTCAYISCVSKLFDLSPMTKFSELRVRLLHPHYVINALFPLVWFAIRYISPLAELLLFRSYNKTSPDGELQLYGFATILIIVKLINSSTAEERVGTISLFGKLLNVGLLFWYHRYILCGVYILAWSVLFVLSPQPFYLGPSNIHLLTSVDFQHITLQHSVSSSSRIVELDDNGDEILSSSEPHVRSDLEDSRYWIVLFYAPWSTACINFEGVIARISLHYTTKNLRFAKLDVESVNGDLISPYNISTDPTSFDLPTLILFCDGKEIRRLPQLKIDGDGVSNTVRRLGWDRSTKSVVKTFGLEDLFAETKKDK